MSPSGPSGPSVPTLGLSGASGRGGAVPTTTRRLPSGGARGSGGVPARRQTSVVPAVLTGHTYRSTGSSEEDSTT